MISIALLQDCRGKRNTTFSHAFQDLFNIHHVKHPVIILNGVKFVYLRMVVEFMYKGEARVSFRYLLLPLQIMAEKKKTFSFLDLNGFVSILKDFLMISGFGIRFGWYIGCGGGSPS